ncbi:MAG: flavin reductase family protein [Chloroflexi bacterium]|nr:flavin reductase family protein [Chloroflexota bacterium]
MAKVITEDIGRFYHHYPRMVAIVTAQSDGKMNAMAVAWHSSLSFDPPLFGVSIVPKRYTYELIAESKEFGVNFLPYEAAELVASVGGSGGKLVDKFHKFGIATEKPVKTSVPILKVAYAAYECHLVDDRKYGDHRWLVGEVVAVHLLKDSFTLEETMNLDKVKPALYLGNEQYATISKDTVKRLEREVYGRR